MTFSLKWINPVLILFSVQIKQIKTKKCLSLFALLIHRA